MPFKSFRDEVICILSILLRFHVTRDSYTIKSLPLDKTRTHTQNEEPPCPLFFHLVTESHLPVKAMGIRLQACPSFAVAFPGVRLPECTGMVGGAHQCVGAGGAWSLSSTNSGKMHAGVTLNSDVIWILRH